MLLLDRRCHMYHKAALLSLSATYHHVQLGYMDHIMNQYGIDNRLRKEKKTLIKAELGYEWQ